MSEFDLSSANKKRKYLPKPYLIHAAVAQYPLGDFRYFRTLFPPCPMSLYFANFLRSEPSHFWPPASGTCELLTRRTCTATDFLPYTQSNFVASGKKLTTMNLALFAYATARYCPQF